MTLVDPRVEKQAQILVEHSIKLKKGENVLISADFEAKPLVVEIYKLLVKKGAGEIRCHFSSYEFGEIFYKYATEKQIKLFPKIDELEMKNIDCCLYVSSSTNTRGLTGVDPLKMTKRLKVVRPIIDWRVEKTKWVITKFPTEAQAQESDMSLADYQDFVFSGINGVNWKSLYKSQERLRKLVDKTDKVQIIAKDTNLNLSVKARKAVNASGENNMPDGEVFTSVVENSADGFITFSYPAIYMGREFHDVRLEFNKGKVAAVVASKNQKDLEKIIDTDKGSRYIGELGLGNNYQIKRFTKDILFDEKIGGSIHLALGKGYKETLSKNASAIHWDMICDLRQGGSLLFDGKLIQKNGRWIYG